MSAVFLELVGVIKIINALELSTEPIKYYHWCLYIQTK